MNLLTRSFTPFPVLKTERLILRQLTINDAKEIFELRSNEQVNKYLDREPAGTIEDAKDFINKIEQFVKKNEALYWVISLADTGTFAGTICLFQFSEENKQAEIGYELLPSFQGKGIMQEAIKRVIAFGFDVLSLKVIVASTHIENGRSSRLLEKFNFRIQGNVAGSSDEPFVVYQLEFENLKM